MKEKFSLAVGIPLIGLLAGCCSVRGPAAYHKAATQLGSLPVETVVSSVAEAVLGSEVTSALARENLAIKQVRMVLQLENDVAGDARIAVLATAEGSISRQTAKQLTLQFSVPAPPTTRAFADFNREMVAEKPLLDSKELVAAIGAAAVGAKAASKMRETLHLTDQEVNYEVDFTLVRSLAGGVDVKIASVGFTANTTWTRKAGNQVVVTLAQK